MLVPEKPCLIFKILTSLCLTISNLLALDESIRHKQPSLFQAAITERIFFTALTPIVNVTQTFFLVTDEEAK